MDDTDLLSFYDDLPDVPSVLERVAFTISTSATYTCGIVNLLRNPPPDFPVERTGELLDAALRQLEGVRAECRAMADAARELRERGAPGG